MATYGIDLSNLNEEQRGDVSKRLHELQDTCLEIQGNVGVVAGNTPGLTVEILCKEGFDVAVSYDYKKGEGRV